jgi:hypothetical protein
MRCFACNSLGTHGYTRRQNGGPRAVNGRIAAGDVNTGWSWHLEDVEFVEAAIELCDGRPSDVERQGSNLAEADSVLSAGC